MFICGRPIHTKECGLTARAHDIETVSFTIYFAATGVGKNYHARVLYYTIIRFCRPLQKSVGRFILLNII